MSGISLTIRPLAEDELEAVFGLNVAAEQSVRYVIRASASPSGLCLQREELATPIRTPTWGQNERHTRLALWRRNLAEGASLFGGFVDGGLVGFVLISPLLSDNTIELLSIFVDADRRRAGIGSLLLGEAEERAAAKSASALHLTTVLANAAAVDFYLHHGYRPVQLTDRTVVPSQEPEIRFAKSLRQTAMG